MIKILFICHGNICRSPMCEYVLKDLVKKEGLSDKFEIASAATSSEELGNPVYPPAKRKLAEHGIGCDGHHARRMTREDYDYYDYLIGTDQENMHYMLWLWGNDPENKCSLIMDYTGHPREVSDPWYTRDFEATWRDVSEGCAAFLEYLKREHLI